MRIHLRPVAAVVILASAACTQASAERPTNTPRPFPSPTRIFIAGLRPTSTPRAIASPTHTASAVAAASPTPMPTPTDKREPTLPGAPRADAAPSGPLPQLAAPSFVASALRAHDINANVYWFMSGDEAQLMIQYASPIRGRAGYAERLEQVKIVAAENFLRIQEPFYALYIAATDLTGTSDTVLRLDRRTVERWARGEMGDADFYNNGFVPARIVLSCEGGACTGVRPTPYPTFPPFPFPFPTPTLIPTILLPTPTP